MNPPWLRIARDYPDNASGPTIPFLIGAIRDPIGATRTPEEDRGDLHALLLSMDRGAPDKSTVMIRWCGVIHEYIAEQHNEYIPTKYTAASTTAKSLDWRIRPEDAPNVADLQALEAFLWQRYEGALSEQRFSWIDQDWRPFSPPERSKIQATLENEGPQT